MEARARGRAAAARHDSRVGFGGDGKHGSLVSMWTSNAFAIVVTLCQKSITLPVIDVQLSESREGTNRETVRVSVVISSD